MTKCEISIDHPAWETCIPLLEHVASTYEGHYVTDCGNQHKEFLESQGWAPHFYLGCITKYASRYPKTENKKDLLKIAHYALMLYHYEEATHATSQQPTTSDGSHL